MEFERIKALRQDHDLTQQQIADYLKISRSTYSAYENGANSFPLEVIIKLSHYYHTSTDFLLNQTDKTEPYPPKK